MTREQIIQMAREAGYSDSQDWSVLVRFAALVAAAEREVCAKVAEGELTNTAALLSMPPQSAAAFAIAAAIRARGRA